MASRGSFGAGPQGPAGLSTGPASGDLGGTYPSPTLQPTASVASIIRANTLDQLAPAAANVNLNTHKIIGLVNGTVSTDAVAFGQIPTTLPPSGSATGDLAGTYPAPTLNTTSNVSTIIRANRLDQMAAPSASVNMNNQKLTNVSNATVTSDAVNLGQVPTSLPPNGAASGDLSSSYPAPTVAKINGISASGTPAYGQVLAANTSSAATWQILPGFMASTGVTSGGAMTQNGSDSTAFDIVQTVGYITDYVTTPANPTITKVTIPAQTVVISGLNATRTVNWWVADSTGTISSIGSNHLTETQRRNMLQLGATASVPGTGQILTIAPAPTQLVQPYNQLQDLMLSLGPFSISGNIISFNGANLAFNKTAGTAFFPNFKASTEPNDPHTVDDPASAPSSFRYSTQLAGSEGGALLSALDPTHYDLAGVVTLIPGGGATSTIQRVWLFGTGVASTQLLVQYGQNTYPSLSAATAAIGTTNYTVNPDITGSGILLGWITMTKNATDLSNAAQAVFTPAAKFATP